MAGASKRAEKQYYLQQQQQEQQFLPFSTSLQNTSAARDNDFSEKGVYF